MLVITEERNMQFSRRFTLECLHMYGSNTTAPVIKSIMCHKVHSRHIPATSHKFPRVWRNSKWMRRWDCVNGSTCNGRRDPKFPSARCRRMVREDTGTSYEGATCALMAADEAVGCMRAFLRCGGLLDDWSAEGLLSLGFV
ncbi:uncharacterized protein TNCV_4368231 [Trichonephila clavipes]|nr:uncharacterized protein TNCV_4368231 [Trichonephila clavipes]